MTIHKEGYATLAITFAVLFAINGAIYYFFPQLAWLQYTMLGVSAIFFLIILQFFRSPYVPLLSMKDAVLAPADGKVVVIEEVFETEYFQQTRRQVSIFMSPFNVHVNRNPIGGIVRYFRYHPGSYLVAWHPKSSTENERTTLVIENEKGVPVLLRQIAGALARRIRWYVQEADRVQQGAEFGFIKFGSRVDIFLPLDAEVTVSLGEKTTGGKTVIAKLK